MEKQNVVVNTNLGVMPVQAYRDLVAKQHGYRDYKEMERAGKTIPVRQTYYMTEKGLVAIH